MTDMTYNNVSDAVMILDGDGDNPNFDALFSVANFIADGGDTSGEVSEILERVKAWQRKEEQEEGSDFVPEWHSLFS